jgi:gluconolactonase
MRKIDPRKSALIVQDLQNDVIMPGGAFCGEPGPAEHAKSQNVVANAKSLAAAARDKGMPVIHVWYVVEKGAPGLKQNAPLFQAVKSTNGVVRGSWGAAPVEGLEPKRGDFVVEKTRMCAFTDTNLEQILKGSGIERLVITGAWTNFSIEHTARTGADLGYECTVVSDATSTINDEWQNAALNYALTNIAEVGTTAEALAALGARPARRASSPRRRGAARKPAAKK